MQSKAEEIARELPDAQAPDRLVRHYREIGAPAVAAALNVGAAAMREKAREPRADKATPAPAFLLMDDHAA